MLGVNMQALDTTYSFYSLTVQDMQAHYQKAGFEVLLIDNYEEPLETRNVINDATGYSFIIARKV